MAEHATQSGTAGGGVDDSQVADWIAIEFEKLEAHHQREVKEQTSINNRLDDEPAEEAKAEEGIVGEEVVEAYHQTQQGKKRSTEIKKQLDALIDEVQKMRAQPRSERREIKANTQPQHYLPHTHESKSVHHHDVSKYADVPAPTALKQAKPKKQKVIKEVAFTELKPKSEANHTVEYQKLRDTVLQFMQSSEALNELHGKRSPFIEDRMIRRMPRSSTTEGAVSVEEVIRQKKVLAQQLTQDVAMEQPGFLRQWLSHLDIRTTHGAANWIIAAVFIFLATVVTVFVR